MKEINFNYTHIATKQEVFEDGHDPNETVLEANTEYMIQISYPVSEAYSKKFTTGEKGMTRKELSDLICDSYKEMYEEEEKSMTTTQEDLENRGTMLNRPSSDGKYGIWGHDLGDLMLHTVNYEDDNVLHVDVDS